MIYPIEISATDEEETERERERREPEIIWTECLLVPKPPNRS